MKKGAFIRLGMGCWYARVLAVSCWTEKQLPRAQTHVSLVNLECERHVFIEVASAERFF
jgi:hypothetical protein